MNNPLLTTNTLPIQSDDEVLDLMAIVHSLWGRKWIIMTLSVVVAVLVGLWVGAKPPVFEARATLLIEQGESSVVSIQNVYTEGYRGWEYMQTQFELLRSRTIAERVVRRLELNNIERFEPKPPPPKPWYEIDFSALKPAGFNEAPPQQWVMPTEEQQIQALTSMVASQVQVQQIGESNLVSLTYRSDDPQLAARIANTYLEEYIQSFLDAKDESTLQAVDWLNERLGEIRQIRKESEDKLQAFRDQEKLVDLQGVTTLSAQEISNLNATYSQSRQRRLELETTQNELERLKDASVDELLTIPAILNHDAVRRLKQSETDAQRAISQLSLRYGPKHPKMTEAASQLASVREALEAEVKNVVYGIQREYQLALNNELSSKAQLDSTKLDLQEINRKEFMLRELEREVESNSQLYDIFFTRVKETGQAGVYEAPPARIIDLSQGGVQVGPNIRRSVTMGFMLAFVIACGLSVLLDFVNNTIKTPMDVEEKLHKPLLGTLPVLKRNSEGGLAEYWDNPKSEFAEAVRTIRTGVVLSGLDKPAKIIVVTSSIPGEGKSTLALNLAAAFAQMEKTLVIGADLRRPSLARRCGLPAKHPGLSNYVAGSATLEECISQWGDSQLSVMPAGIIPSNPLEMLSSHRFRDALEMLKSQFSRIVIDSAPVAAVSDALMLASYADALIFVVKSDSTTATMAKKSISQLEGANELLTGVVLNHFDPKKSTKYYSAYNYRYSESYYNTSDTHG